MADLTQVYAALQKADAAGDTAGAKQLADYIRANGNQAAPAAQAPQQSPNALGATASTFLRPLAEGAAGLPLMAMDAGVATSNLIGNAVQSNNPSDLQKILLGDRAYSSPNAELPSATFRKALDYYTQAPQTVIGKVSEGIGAMLAGGAVPGPTGVGGALSEVPSDVMNARQAARLVALRSGQKEGYVVAPSSTNPTFMNRLLEGISGKAKLQQQGSEMNQGVTQTLGAEALGQHPESVLTPDALKTIAADAFQQGYVPLKNAGQVTASEGFGQRLSSIIQSLSGPTKSFPKLQGNATAADDISALNEPTFDAGDAVDAIRMFRDKAGDAFGSGQKSVGTAYRAAAKTVEDELERHLADTGQGDLLTGYKNARQLIAQTHSTESALADDLGTISARKFGAQLGSGVPLVGQQRTIGSFAQSFPKFSQVMTDSQPSISPVDAYGAIIAAGAAHSAAPLAYPLSRVGIRNYLLSPQGQARAIPTQAPSNLPQQMAEGALSYAPLAGPKPYLGLPGGIPVMQELFSGQ
jgi:hypothetical protein